MKLLDKLKNALFEEEYVEVEEKPRNTKQKSEKMKKTKSEKSKKEMISEQDYYEEEKPIAKRILPQEKKTNDLEEKKSMVKESSQDQELLRHDEEPKITVVTEEDLKTDDFDYPLPTKPIEITKRRSENKDIDTEEKIIKESEPKLYQASKKQSYLENYKPHEYGNYEKQKEKEKEGFKPSPIISPIYGIVEDKRFMDKQPRREVRITTTVSHDKMDIDQIRKKAFGDLSEEIEDNIELDNDISKVEENSITDNNTLLDFTDSDSTPEVDNITVGDAVEYFEDLGLEYNEDYIDSSKMTRSKKNANLENIEEEKDDDNLKKTANDDVIVREKNDDDSITDSENENLFDLIDSMYE